jgi:Arc/MetJ-type ribon-helix-helix transcriptional regulator
VKISVSLAEEDVAFLDDYAGRSDVTSRSGAVQRAIALLRATELGPAYAEAWADWDVDGDGDDPWATTSADGLDVA